MNPFRILADAFAIGMSAIAGLSSIAGFGGARNGWLDVVNNFAPFILILGALGGVFAYLALGAGPTRLAALLLASVGAAYAVARILPEYAKSWGVGSGQSRLATYRVVSANIWRGNRWPTAAVEELLNLDADA